MKRLLLLITSLVFTGELAAEEDLLAQYSIQPELLDSAFSTASMRSYPFVEPQTHSEERWSLYQLSGTDSIRIEGLPCTDSMSGEQFASRVTIELVAVNNSPQQLHGCGRALY